jgi:hypothetical protein
MLPCKTIYIRLESSRWSSGSLLKGERERPGARQGKYSAGLTTNGQMAESDVDCSSVIRVEHLQAATALWDYCEASVQYVFATKTGNQCADRIIEALTEAENGYLTDDIGRLFGGHRTREKNLALDFLLRLDKATKESRQTKGRPVTIWRTA